MEGYIKLSRKFFSNDMWNEARTFSSCEAYDLRQRPVWRVSEVEKSLIQEDNILHP